MNSEKPIAIGLLPLYLKLYDDIMPERRQVFAPFIESIAARLQTRGMRVVTAPIVRVAEECRVAVETFRDRVDVVVTLHLAYSPSLEALPSLLDSSLPIVMLDTTIDAAFGPEVNAERIMYNHGVHGVMDLANMLRRNRRHFEIVAGREDCPRTLDRVADLARAARAASSLQGVVALRIGAAFAGMGDFAVPEGLLRERFGITLRRADMEALDRAVEQVTDEAVEKELASDRRRYNCRLDAGIHRVAVSVGLGLRQVLEQEGCDAFSINFQAFDRPDRAACAMPFLEISKAMARGTGYGGEGDILTAALAGALMRGFGPASFTEIFCADWAGNTLFLSHMGEVNPALADGRPHLFAKPSFDGRSRDTAVLTCALRPGPAMLVNLAPGPDDRFALIVAPVEVLAEGDRLDRSLRDTIRAWIKPACPVAEFLESYSRAGGTHHSVLVPDTTADAVAAFGRFLDLPVTMIA